MHKSSCNVTHIPIISAAKKYTNMLDISTQSYFILKVLQPTWLYLTIIQKSKRGKSKSLKDRSYWYGNLSLIVLEASQNCAENSNANLSTDKFLSNLNSEKTKCIKNENYSTDEKMNQNRNGNSNECRNETENRMKRIQNNKEIKYQFGEVLGCTFSGSVRASSSVELQLLLGMYVCLCPCVCLCLCLCLCPYVFECG